MYHNFSWHRHALEKHLGVKNLEQGLYADVMHMARLVGKEVSGFSTETPPTQSVNVIETFQNLEADLRAIPWGDGNWDFLQFYKTHWLELAPTLAEIENRGVGLDVERLREITEKATTERAAAEERFRSWLKHRFSEEAVATAREQGDMFCVPEKVSPIVSHAHARTTRTVLHSPTDDVHYYTTWITSVCGGR